MKILITVGTTSFDNLIKAADQQLSASHQLTFQIAQGEYKPVNHQYFRFSDEIENYYRGADLIISHGGAGTIYQVLEMDKKLIMVPNLERIDHHQIDICDYMQKNAHALSCFELDKLGQLVVEVQDIDFAPYRTEEFSGINDIRNYLGLKLINE